MHLWKLEQPAAAVANEYFVGAINRVGIEELGDDDFYGTIVLRRPGGQLRRRPRATRTTASSSSATSTSTCSTDVRNQWAFYRDRRPDAYGDLTRP